MKHDIVVPVGYRHVKDKNGTEFLCKPGKLGTDGEIFYLRNRTFGDGTENDIDYWMKGAISNAIEEAVRKNPYPRVLDVGGGYLHKAAYDIVLIYDSVEVTSIDLCFSPDAMKHPRLKAVQGDITQSKLTAECFDVVYSFQVLPNMPLEKSVLALKKIERALKPEGVAVLDWIPARYFRLADFNARVELEKDLEKAYPIRLIEGEAAPPGESPKGYPPTYISFRKGTAMPPGPKRRNAIVT